MVQLRVAIVGFGRLGRACAAAVADCHDLGLAGVVRHGGPTPLPHPLEHAAASGHLRDLGHVDAALVCVPPQAVTGVAREILQQRVPVIECAMLDGGALAAHYDALDATARHHRVAAVVGAGWDPGVLPLLRRLFEVLIPRGHTDASVHPGVALHHSALEFIPGVRGALACERRTVDGRTRHYVYVKLDGRAAIGDVEKAIAGDPIYDGAETLVFPVEDLAALEAAGAGVLLTRHGTAQAGAHQSILLEARFDVASFAARVMLDAVRMLRVAGPGAHRYRLEP